MPILSSIGGASKRGFAKYPTAAGTITYAFWNPADKSGGVSLTNSNLTASVSTGPPDGGTVRSTIGKTSGKWYWEYKAESGFALSGIANASASIAAQTYPGIDANGWSYYTPGTKLNNGGSASYGAAYNTNDIIGVKLDMDNKTVEFLKNNVSQGVAFTGLTGTVYAATGNYTINQPLVTANFGASAFTYSVPSGYNSGLFTNSIIYTTWNPADKGTNISLSNGNLSISTTSTGGMVRSVIGKSSGKWYWEVTKTGGSDMAVGIAKSTANLSSYLGSDANGYSYVGSNGNKLNNATSTAYGSTYGNSVVIGVAMDLDNGTLTFYRNGVSQGTAFSGLSGTFYAAEGTTNNGDASTANFGATAFSFSPPAGFNAGLY